MELAFVGYHSTELRHKASISNRGWVVQRKNDKSFLGTGIYFWENNIDLAHWWANRKNGWDEYLIYSAYIKVDSSRFLDFTIADTKFDLLDLVAEIEQKTGLKVRLGTALNLYCAKRDEPYDVIRGAFPGDRTGQLFAGANPLDIRLILSVRKPKAINEHSLCFAS